MFRRLSKLAVLYTFGVLGAYMLIPEDYYPERLKPINHLFNVTKAGINMIVIYKYSSK
jgi:hypothetical protein